MSSMTRLRLVHNGLVGALLDGKAFEMERDAYVIGITWHSLYLFPKPKRLNAQGQTIECLSPKELIFFGMGVR